MPTVPIIYHNRHGHDGSSFCWDQGPRPQIPAGTRDADSVLDNLP